VVPKEGKRDGVHAAQSVVEGHSGKVGWRRLSPGHGVHQGVEIDHVVPAREPGDLALECGPIPNPVVHDDEGAPPHCPLEDAGDWRAPEVMVPVLRGIGWVNRHRAQATIENNSAEGKGDATMSAASSDF
jgi:hypothetical protein